MVSRFNHARDAFDFLVAAVGTTCGVVKYSIFGPEFLNGRVPASWVVFAKHVT
jgi:hypothetical protein